MHFIGPISLRNRMPSEWRKNDGMTEIFTFINHYICTLPRMPSNSKTLNATYGELLSRSAFLNRCLSIKRQTEAYFRHPLLFEMSVLRSERRLILQRKISKLWEKKQQGELKKSDLVELNASLISNQLIFSNAASSLGSVNDRLQHLVNNLLIISSGGGYST
jgi:hypothetical protein